MLLVAILAGGRADRFGGGKLDADLAGRAVGAHVVATARSLGAPLVAVAPPDAPRFIAEAGLDCIADARVLGGIGHSVALAAEAALARRATRLLICLADMPLVSPQTLRALADVEPRTAAAVRQPDGSAGPPACFGTDLLPRLAALAGDKGAKAVLAALQDVRLIDASSNELIDIDTRDDLSAAARYLARRAAS